MVEGTDTRLRTNRINFRKSSSICRLVDVSIEILKLSVLIETLGSQLVSTSHIESSASDLRQGYTHSIGILSSVIQYLLAIGGVELNYWP